MPGALKRVVSVTLAETEGGPQLFKVEQNSTKKGAGRPAGSYKRFKDFEKLHKELKKRASAGTEAALPELPEKHLIGLGLWRDKEKTLAERAAALEAYINDVLTTGSHEAVVAVADELQLDFLELASFFLERADSGEEEEETASSAGLLTRAAGAATVGAAFVVGACWIMMLAAWVAACDVAGFALSAGKRTFGKYAPSLTMPKVRAPKVSLKVLSSLPPSLRHLYLVSVSAVNGTSTFSDARSEWSATLAGLAAEAYLMADRKLDYSKGYSLTARLPAKPKDLCQRGLQACWPDLITAVHARASYPTAASSKLMGAAGDGVGSIPPSPSFDPAVLLKEPPSTPPAEDDLATVLGTPSNASTGSVSPTGSTFSLVSLAAAASDKVRSTLPTMVTAANTSTSKMD